MASDSSSITQPNAYSPFATSQWTNPYSAFYGKALPWPSSYAGTPTNAMGQPIQPPQGMTLNSTPAQPQAAAQPQGPMTLQQLYGSTPGSSAMNPSGNGALFAANWGGMMGPSGMMQMDAAQRGNSGMGMPPLSNGSAQAAAGAGGAAAPPNNWQQTLGMLANPGHVATPGATVPQAQSSTAVQPGVLQNFLANWQPQQSGAGSGFTQNFNSILRGLQAQKGS